MTRVLALSRALGAAAGTVALLATGCTAAGPDPSDSPDRTVPTAQHLVSGRAFPADIDERVPIEGTVTAEAGCVVLDEDGTMSLLVWPTGGEVTGGGSVVRLPGGQITLGARLTASTGWRLPHEAFVAWLEEPRLDDVLIEGWEECSDLGLDVIVLSIVEGFDQQE